MLLSEMVVRSKLIPPQPYQAIYRRPRLIEKLSRSHQFPLTVVHAGTGFGKTTALLELSGCYRRACWYNITVSDRDPTLFLAHLLSAFLPDTAYLIDRLEQGGISSTTAVLNGLINHLTTDLEEDVLLVLDDFHLVNDVPEIQRWLELLIEQHPPYLHTAIACRQIPQTSSFIRWRVKGNVLLVDQADLSFTRDEICSLFSSHHHFPISDQDAQTLYAYTDGWIIALQMIWQRLAAAPSKRLDTLLTELPAALPEVFTFLAHEVLMRQSEPLQRFLINSSILRQMDAEACNQILDISNSQDLLKQIYEKGLFVFTVDQVHYRYQRLFQDFLLSQVNMLPDQAAGLHRRAAAYYSGANEYEEAIFHLLNSGNSPAAAELIQRIGPKMLDIGRPGTLVKWIEQVGEDILSSSPALFLLQGDALRLTSHFEEALAAYQRAETVSIREKDQPGRSRALRSKARVYLDTIRPLKASSLLVEAMSLLEPQEHPAEVSELLDLLAENKLNLGKPEEARTLHREANMLRAESVPDDIYLESRSLLRTGRLQEARDLIESSGALAEGSAGQRPQRFHREMPLLLSLIYLMLGEVSRGEYYARQGIETGRQLGSPFVEAVGLMRLGHASQLAPRTSWKRGVLVRARECYERSIELVRPFNVMRVQVEPLWGLCRYHGYQGNILEANRCAAQAIEIAETSGDYWFAALLRTTMGTSYSLAGEYVQAEDWLEQAVQGFLQVGDRFGQAAAGCSRMLNTWLGGNPGEAVSQFDHLVPALKANQLDFLLTRPSHLGLQETQPFIPLLVEAASRGVAPDYAGRILSDLGLSDLDYHPGYGLDIRCLGPFEVRRGKEPINLHEWQRDKARQLFQFFTIRRGKWFTRDQIAEYLWPGAEGDSAAQNLKVTLNALNHALEPRRDAGKKPFFITRRDTLYAFNPAAKITIDVDDFECLAVSDREEDLVEALAMYAGDYLSECVDDHLAADTRERLREMYFSAALRLAGLYFRESRWDAAVKTCHDILAQDVCNEPAFQLLMRSHAARGSRSAVNTVYQRCCTVLREELDVSPAEETTRLWEELTG